MSIKPPLHMLQHWKDMKIKDLVKARENQKANLAAVQRNAEIILDLQAEVLEYDLAIQRLEPHP